LHIGKSQDISGFSNFWTRVRRFIIVYSRRATGFPRRAKVFELNLNFGQNLFCWDKSSSKLVNSPGAPPLIKQLTKGMPLYHLALW